MLRFVQLEQGIRSSHLTEIRMGLPEEEWQAANLDTPTFT